MNSFVKKYTDRKFWKHTENIDLSTYKSKVAYSVNAMKFSISYPKNHKKNRRRLKLK